MGFQDGDSFRAARAGRMLTEECPKFLVFHATAEVGNLPGGADAVGLSDNFGKHGECNSFVCATSPRSIRVDRVATAPGALARHAKCACLLAATAFGLGRTSLKLASFDSGAACMNLSSSARSVYRRRQAAASARRGRFGAAKAADNAQRLEEFGAKVRLIVNLQGVNLEVTRQPMRRTMQLGRMYAIVVMMLEPVC